MRLRLASLLLAAPLALSAQSSKYPAPGPRGDRDTLPYPPFRIIDNVYYVGSVGLAVFLVTTPQGHILIDTGLRQTATKALENITTLGFKPTDVKIMLSTHGHFDHVEAFAMVKAATGAKVYASAADARLLESGGAEDFLLGKYVKFDSVKVDHILQDGERVSLGGTTLTAHLTPGHTKGSTMWTMTVADAGKTYELAIAPSMVVNDGVKLANWPPYPTNAADYARSFEFLETQHPDVFLAPHTRFFNMEAKAAKLREGAATNPFIDPEGYRTFIAGLKKTFLAQLAKDQGTPVP